MAPLARAHVLDAEARNVLKGMVAEPVQVQQGSFRGASMTTSDVWAGINAPWLTNSSWGHGEGGPMPLWPKAMPRFTFTKEGIDEQQAMPDAGYGQSPTQSYSPQAAAGYGYSAQAPVQMSSYTAPVQTAAYTAPVQAASYTAPGDFAAGCSYQAPPTQTYTGQRSYQAEAAQQSPQRYVEQLAAMARAQREIQQELQEVRTQCNITNHGLFIFRKELNEFIQDQQDAAAQCHQGYTSPSRFWRSPDEAPDTPGHFRNRYQDPNARPGSAYFSEAPPPPAWYQEGAESSPPYQPPQQMVEPHITDPCASPPAAFGVGRYGSKPEPPANLGFDKSHDITASLADLKERVVGSCTGGSPAKAKSHAARQGKTRRFWACCC